jgi:predicted flap endonuclease-1-like 5' DNA nuclease
MILMAGSSGKRVTGTLLFLLAVISVLAFYFIVFADAQQVNGVPGAGNLGVVATMVAIILGIAVIGLIALLLMRSTSRNTAHRTDEPNDFFVPPTAAETFTPAFETVDDDLAVYNIWQLPIAQRAWTAPEDERTHSFYFPLNVESGVYVNDYIALDGQHEGPRLKLRTLLAGPPDVQAASFAIPAATPAEQDAPQPYAEPAPRPAPAVVDLPGDAFMRELEGRFQGNEPATVTVAAEPVEATQELYYDYRGDDHKVIEVEGIGTVYAAKLEQAGITTTGRLCYEKPEHISSKIGAPQKTVVVWQAMAQMMKVSGIGPQYAEALARAGITGIDELKRRQATAIAEQTNKYLESKAVTITSGTISERRVSGWQEAAKSMRRVRQAIPAS